MLTVGLSICLEKQAESADTGRSLNIVFILADDLGWGELGCYGQEKIPTPNIDRLAAEGMRFTQFYSGAPVCAPSRCVLMTGKHLGHAEIRGNRQAKTAFPEFNEGQYPLTEQAVTVAQVFQQAGYATGAFGKWGLGPVGSTGEPSRKGFDLFFGYNCQAVAHSYYPSHLWRNSEHVLINTKPIPGHMKKATDEVRIEDTQGETYAPRLMIEGAETFLKENQDRPFFLYLPFIEPHVAMHPPVASVEKFPTEWDPEVYRGESGYLPHPRPHAGYAAMISDLDGYVGQVVETLKSTGNLERTLIIFTSDNGTTHAGPAGTKFHIGGADAAFFNSTRELKGYKGSVYEGGIRVPMIARLPGVIPAGVVNETPGYFADWFPTLCAAAKLPTPANLDGENLWPVLTGAKTLDHRKPMVWVFPEYGGQVAVRIGSMKVLRRGLSRKKPDDWEVYDLSQDPGEEHNLAESQPQWIDQARTILSQETSENAVFPVAIPQ
ncbi:sulfatase-like hydrolase/transferase [bacterium]|nr:sulfatase-like hydrolase/transferase [bacterium]